LDNINLSNLNPLRFIDPTKELDFIDTLRSATGLAFVSLEAAVPVLKGEALGALLATCIFSSLGFS
jgi:hypothetical protein